MARGAAVRGGICLACGYACSPRSGSVRSGYDHPAYRRLAGGHRGEALCLYIDGTLGDAGIDVAALAARHGLSRYAITGQ
jgi:hypothetical protein